MTGCESGVSIHTLERAGTPCESECSRRVLESHAGCSMLTGSDEESRDVRGEICIPHLRISIVHSNVSGANARISGANPVVSGAKAVESGSQRVRRFATYILKCVDSTLAHLRCEIYRIPDMRCPDPPSPITPYTNV